MSDSFTIDDIHRIRFEHYEQTKSMTHDERMQKTQLEIAPFWKRFTEMGGVSYSSKAELLAARTFQ